MAADPPRSAQLRAQIQVERAELEASVDELKTSAVDTAIRAGIVLAGLVGLVIAVKLIARRFR
jgi:preprotein translocase subunit Sss1